MTNADKYLKDGVDVEELTDAILKYNEQTRGCTFYENMRSFWKSEVKPTLKEDEKVILRNIRDFEIPENNVQTIIIGNNKAFGGLYIEFIYNYDNGKGTTGVSSHKEEFRLFNHLFQFIKPRRRI